MTKGVYPDGFQRWEIEAIEKFRDGGPELYEWRKTAHLLQENMCRAVGRAIPVPLPRAPGKSRGVACAPKTRAAAA